MDFGVAYPGIHRLQRLAGRLFQNGNSLSKR